MKCSYAKIPLSVYYLSLLSSQGYDLSTVTPEVDIKFTITASGTTLLSEIVSKHFNNTSHEVSGTTPPDGSANFYVETTSNAIKNDGDAPTNEDVIVYFTIEAIDINDIISRTIVSGTCTISTGGIKTWYFDQN